MTDISDTFVLYRSVGFLYRSMGIISISGKKYLKLKITEKQYGQEKSAIQNKQYSKEYTGIYQRIYIYTNVSTNIIDINTQMKITIKNPYIPNN